MEVTRRIADSSDLELLFEINCAALKDHVRANFGAWDEGFQRRSFWDSTDPFTHELFYSGSQPAGFWSVTRDETQICLERLSLLPEFRNCGLGSSLVRELIAEARASNRPLRLQAFLCNRARRLYERLGFRIVGATDSHYHMEFAGFGVEFAFLANHPKLVPTIAQWWLEAWPTYRVGLDDLIREIRDDLHTDRVPVHVIALDMGRVVGSAALKQHELRKQYPELQGWLGSVFVVQDARRKGIASALCARVIDLAIQFGLSELHLQTQDTTGGLYARLGWQTIDRTTRNGADTLIMKRRVPRSPEPPDQAV